MSDTRKRRIRTISIGLLITRVTAGAFMLLAHGVPKFNMAFGGDEIQFADPIGLGPAVSLYLVVFAEFFCSILLILGVYTRLIVIPLIITMGVAIFIHNAGEPFANIEKAALFMAVFTGLLFTGAGKYSIDGMKSSDIA